MKTLTIILILTLCIGCATYRQPATVVVVVCDPAQAEEIGARVTEALKREMIEVSWYDVLFEKIGFYGGPIALLALPLLIVRGR